MPEFGRARRSASNRTQESGQLQENSAAFQVFFFQNTPRRRSLCPLFLESSSSRRSILRSRGFAFRSRYTHACSTFLTSEVYGIRLLSGYSIDRKCTILMLAIKFTQWYLRPAWLNEHKIALKTPPSYFLWKRPTLREIPITTCGRPLMSAEKDFAVPFSRFGLLNFFFWFTWGTQRFVRSDVKDFALGDLRSLVESKRWFPSFNQWVTEFQRQCVQSCLSSVSSDLAWYVAGSMRQFGASSDLFRQSNLFWSSQVYMQLRHPWNSFRSFNKIRFQSLAFLSWRGSFELPLFDEVHERRRRRRLISCSCHLLALRKAADEQRWEEWCAFDTLAGPRG